MKHEINRIFVTSSLIGSGPCAECLLELSAYQTFAKPALYTAY